ncbi:2-keto-4-pentenoate hydratase/2-oxohepta-3-ene-1,7-dioic acid hydratase (catechol pathway) [Acinetobacter marinus]|uniref:2-keto-4-pentenoate hydratase/2-oxohepta-3-ene-1,7-dioic acid hydratase (Catechol pathway) n=1 Tax=Acinetobacter marinus TaxID=281375 RepID=A0A1G6GK17_9GAMM|nr:fumarylacetoacetate hydrolase family protein [Acinetobacter marinus]SDB82085.1 2-keto-4-pentenoate hydratase/2-oxohepta-3-ene-1,7-dioic acid hydratase (catechol pathway) [Acinetobacter marinus]
MALPILRFQYQDKIYWGLQKSDVVIFLATKVETTAEFIALGYETIDQLAQNSTDTVLLDQVEVLSPITAEAQVLCQGMNYRQHAIESGIDPDQKKHNMLFTKSAISKHAPSGEIIKPDHVQLLDYEIELALVLGKNTDSSVQVTALNLHEYVAGICIANDITARDIQIPQMQFYKGKSYRTFCPLGPVLCLLNQHEMHYLEQLNLTLKVNGEMRQQDNTANMLFKPAETLTEFSEITDFHIGDVLLTGSPAGCALSLPASNVARMTDLMTEPMIWKLFLKSQSKRTQYLQSGDQIESYITSNDGKVDLGLQQHTVKA